ncbi:methionine--tRNA ligase [Desulfurispira natronophila]|uniref:Methionine--tRNA ligase n=1 Tax=Desulfurispira natronophila TaxID=682562 RepID=A0A7W7Y500_9BACT|nr:methionine--tRNA ligase [Desulfurispira natronophila]MBB5022181.1 methionyl-tRNA synthetase [Desulfurispira natronophila]
MSQTYYVTTPIYYVNDVPHIGHAYTTVACDVAARYHRLAGKDVMFLTGTDEHGMKIERAATANGQTPIELASRVVKRFQELWQVMDISHDDFIRTTEDRHKAGVHKLFCQLKDQGDIYLGEYEGWYCTPCESFWTETQVGESCLCPDCGRPVEKLKEQSYFFRMSKYAQPLLEHIRQHPEFIQPESRRNEIVRFVESGLRDLSISRTTFDWGIKVPDDSDHVLYVWFDALSNYMTAIGYGTDEEKFQRYWPASVHVVGKDILRFHTVYWPTFLMAAGIELPRQVFAHGWWTVEGKKMSKSLMNAVDPATLVEQFGVDAIRYFLMREVPFGLDGDFSMQALVGRINSDLANDLGNLLNRISGMIFRYFDGTIPPAPASSTQREAQLISATAERISGYRSDMEHMAFNRALMKVWELISSYNKYIVETEPWTLHKAGKTEELQTVLATVAEGMRIIANATWPFMPGSSERILQALGCELEGNLEFDYSASSRTMQQMPVLFSRVEDIPVIAEEGEGEEESTPRIDFDTFLQVSIKAGRIVGCQKVPKSSKLLKLEVDLGEGRLRTIVSGIAQSYSPEDLLDKNVSVIANLKPAKLMGIESEGMILAAKTAKNRFEVPFLSEQVKPGTDIR